MLGTAPAAAVLLLAVACRTAPPLAVSAEAGTVRAHSPATAHRVLEQLEELRPEVEALLGTNGEGVFEVWVSERKLEHGSGEGFTLRSERGDVTIHLWVEAEPAILAHELVHALRPEWLALHPPLMEEGVAEWVAERVAPAADELARLSKLVFVAAHLDSMLLSLGLREPDGTQRTLSIELRLAGEPDAAAPETLFALSDREEFRERVEEAGTRRGAGYYALAELCVERLVARDGLPALQNLAQRALDADLESVPWPWIAEASGLQRREDWLEASRARLTAEDVRSLALNQPGLIVAPLAVLCESLLQPRFPEARGAELLRLSAARLEFASGEPLPLVDIAPLVGALESEAQPPNNRN
jgi:hypothetical protein